MKPTETTAFRGPSFRSNSPRRHLREEVADEVRDLGHGALKQKVPAGQQVDMGAGQVAGEGSRTLRTEDLVPLAPYREQRHLALAEVLVQARVELHVGGVVTK